MPKRVGAGCFVLPETDIFCILFVGHNVPEKTGG